MHHMPLVRVFSSKGLKERHWRDISEIVRFNINPDKSETLNRIIKMELTKEDYDKLEEISDKAAKEYGIEKILQKMKDVRRIKEKLVLLYDILCFNLLFVIVSFRIGVK